MNEHPWRNKNMSVKSFLEKGGGNFASPKNTVAGEEYIIEVVYFDGETYPKNPAMVVNTTKDGEEFKIRLSKANTKRIAETLSDDETKWVGNKLHCLGHMDYPGLGKPGLLWSGMKVGQQAGLKPPVNLNAPKPNAVANTLSTDTYQWLMVSQSDIGHVLDGPTWNNIVQRGISKELDRYGLISFVNGEPVLSEKCREFL